MRIYFMRHAQSGNNAAQDNDTVRYEGRVPDPELTEIGRQQARLAGKWFSQYNRTIQSCGFSHGHEEVSAIFCSPMIRALQTAEALVEAFPGVPVVALPELCEVGGLFSGPRRSPSGSPRSSRSPSPARSGIDTMSTAVTTPSTSTLHTLLATPTVSSHSARSPRIAGSSSRELSKRFPFVKLPPHASNSGWWNQDRETNQQAIHRAWDMARTLWKHAVSHPKSTILIITHGLFQDLLLKVLLSSTFMKPHQWPQFPPDSPSVPISLSALVADMDTESQEDNGKQSAGLGDASATTKPPAALHIEASSNSPSLTLSCSSSIEWPSLQCRDGDDVYVSHDQSFFLCNNVGVSLLELDVLQPQNSKDDNLDCCTPMNARVDLTSADTSRNTNCGNAASPATPLDHAEMNNHLNGGDASMAPSLENCSSNVSITISPDPELDLHDDFENDKIYRCAILFWNQHSFLTGPHLVSSGQSIDAFSIF